ncbi:MAG: fructose-bisphosphatase class III [Lachnospiraceae bacterium]|nr:fructose-bisphosphatase class III [Lachnospiraceae bacterium]
MRTFVVSDIHGHFDTFMRLLRRIDFAPEDFMYVVGDVIDRGRDGIQLLRFLMKQKNMELFMGNHELMMLNAIDFERQRRSGLIEPDPFDDRLTPYELWTHPANGGEETWEDFYNLPKAEQDAMEDYLRRLRLIKRIKIGKKSYHISHSYSLARRFGTELFYKDAGEREAERIVWESLFDRSGDPYAETDERPFAYKSDIYIVGHIFTQRLNHVNEEGQGMIFKSTKYRGYHVIDMDCGMAINSHSSRLGCLLLETGEEIYQPLFDEDQA